MEFEFTMGLARMVNMNPNLWVSKYYDNSRCVVTTSWDDGFSTDMEILKILNQNGIKGTFYVPTGSIGKESYLSWENLKEIVKHKHEIGAHTHTHKILTETEKKDLIEEIQIPKEILEEKLKIKIIGFAYPKGFSDKNVREIAKKSNYLYARNANTLNLSFPPKDIYIWTPTLIAQGRGGLRKRNLPKLIKYKSFFKTLSNYPEDWSTLAKQTFSIAYKRKLVWHLYGHSKIISEKEELSKLSNIFRYIKKKKGIWFATNGELIKYYLTIKSMKIIKFKKSLNEITFKIQIEPFMKTFDHPLTFLSKIGESRNINVQINDKSIKPNIIKDSFLKINVNPKPEIFITISKK